MKSVRENYRVCQRYLKESKNYFYFIIGLFVVAVLIGYVFPLFFQDFILDFVKQVLDKTKDMGFFELFLFILLNNLKTAFFSILLGVIVIYPLVVGFFNGYVLGFVASRVVKVEGYGVLLRILPHGIFEIPALILSLGIGLKIGMFIFADNKKKYLISNLENGLRVFLFIVLPLLLIAGIIETWLIMLLG